MEMMDTCHHDIDGQLSVVLATTTIHNTKSIRSERQQAGRSRGSGCNDQLDDMGEQTGVDRKGGQSIGLWFRVLVSI